MWCRQDTMTNRLYTFNQTPEQVRRVGARGGRAYGRNRALSALVLVPTKRAVPNSTSRLVTPSESIALLDARFPWLRGAEKRFS